MTIYENIRFGKLNATQDEIEEAAREANAHNFIMQLPDKYETLVGERGIQLSGGEKQRIALARALVKKPTFLLLDEATSALDNNNEKIVQEALDRACKGRTTIVIAHRLTTIRNADQIYVFDKGNVVEQGTHDTLMGNEGGKYQELVKRQQMEKIDDDQDDPIKMQKAKEEEEEAIGMSERSRLISDTQAVVDGEKTSSKSFIQRFVLLRLLSMNGSEWKTIFIGCAACLFSGASQPLFSVFYANVVGAFGYCSIRERRSHVLNASLVFLIFGGILLVLNFLQYTAFAIAGSQLTQRIRSKAFGCLLRQEVAYFDQSENTSGAISVRLSSDAAAVQEMAGTRLGVICQSLALMLFGIAFGCYINWQLTFIVLVSLIVMIFLTFGDMSLRVWQGKQNDKIMGRASTLAVEVIHNMRTIKQSSVEKEVLRQYSDLIYEAVRLCRMTMVPISVLSGIYWTIDVYTMAFVYWRALVLVEEKQLTSHHIIMVVAYSMFALQAIKLMGMLSYRIAGSVSAAQSFFNLFDRIPTIDNGSDEGQELDDFHGDIKFDDVKFIYPTRPTSVVLNKFQLNIMPSQRVALAGGSGCGKSTTIQLLQRFYDVKEGQILLDGVDIRQLNIHWVRSQFGLVSQEPILFDLTIAENIAYGLEDVSMTDIIDAAKKANIHQFIEQLPDGYETKVGIKGSFLSGGEKQRIAIARVLIRRPKVLLLDEATSAMDSQNEQIVQEALEHAQIEDPSRTSLIIAHRLSTIRSCDSICVVNKGKVIESGTHTELTQQRGAYYKMLTQNH
ncbi:unnamed protein product [Rotaria socialis]|uniref:Uncharacterized protein n=2 Tax=Rotaria socialis TaxID=392032 RepID=A0A818JGK0_9BILA|nr:unnamed protein product [Rotaria socialis]